MKYDFEQGGNVSIKARLIYILIILFIYDYSNSIGSTVIPLIATLLFFIILIPPLSRLTKVDFLHEKFIELAFKKSKHEAAKQSSSNNQDNSTSEGDGLFYDTEAPEELDYDRYVDGSNDQSISSPIARRPA